MSGDCVGGGGSALGGALDLRELFPSEWMREYTEFDDVDAFIDTGDGIPVTRGSDRRPAWNEHVAESTTFDDWEEMLGRALDDYSARRTASATN